MPQARAAIRRAVRQKERAEIGEIGKKLFDGIASQVPARIGKKAIGQALQRLDMSEEDDLFYAIGAAQIEDREVMIDVMNNATWRNFNTEHPIKDHVLPRSFAAGFKLGLMAKDVKIAGDLGEHMNVDAPLSRMVRERWADALEALGADQDFTRAITHWERVGEASAD